MIPALDLATLPVTLTVETTRYARTSQRGRRRTAKVRPRAVTDQRFAIKKRPRRLRTRKEPKRYYADKSVIGKGTIATAFSLPTAELVLLDAMAARQKMSRSHFIRKAVRFYMAHSSFPDEGAWDTRP